MGASETRCQYSAWLILLRGSQKGKAAAVSKGWRWVKGRRLGSMSGRQGWDAELLRRGGHPGSHPRLAKPTSTEQGVEQDAGRPDVGLDAAVAVHALRGGEEGCAGGVAIARLRTEHGAAAPKVCTTERQSRRG